MALVDTILNMVTRKEKQPETESRSVREARIKDRAGMVISIFALMLAINTWYGGKLGSTILNNTLGANNTWAQYQAKAGRGVNYEIAAATATDKNLREKFEAEKTRMDGDKVELAEKARAMEAARDEAKRSSPWIGYANTAYQLAIVLLSASILAVSMALFWGSFAVAGLGILLSLQGLFLFI
jgi:hypothetical protein